MHFKYSIKIQSGYQKSEGIMERIKYNFSKKCKPQKNCFVKFKQYNMITPTIHIL